MNIVCYASAPHQSQAIGWFVEGLKVHGLDAPIVNPRMEPHRECDLAVFWGHRQVRIIADQKRRKAHYLVMERGYISNRFEWTSLGFDGLNGRAMFPKVDDNRKRWSKYFAKFLKPWRNSKTNLAVIMGQCRGDASLNGLDFPLWVERTAKKLREINYIPVFRPHPGDPELHVDGVKRIEGTLDEALAQARLVATYNSNSGVDAVLSGVPTYAEDQGSMAYPVTGRHFSPTTPDRAKWCDNMAYTQWLPHEIQSGEAWDKLKAVIS